MSDSIAELKLGKGESKWTVTPYKNEKSSVLLL